MNHSLHASWAVAVALTLSVVACGEARPDIAATDAPASVATMVETQVTCGLGSWPVSAMGGGIESGFDMEELTAALEAFVGNVGMMAPEALQGVAIENAPWFVLTESENSVTIATGEWNATAPGANAGVLKFEKTTAGWEPAGYGDCRPNQLRPVLAHGLSWVEITAWGALDRRSNQIVVNLSEIQCSSGRDPRPFLREPSIVEKEDSVTISWTSEAVAVGDCVGTMPVPHRVMLDEPLGDRVLLDGSHWPPRPVVSSQ